MSIRTDDEHYQFDPGGNSNIYNYDVVSPVECNGNPVQLSEFLKQYGDMSEDFEEVDDIGISLDDLEKTNQDSYTYDKWRFSDELTPEQKEQMRTVLSKHDLWSGIGLLNTGEKIKIPLKPEFKDTSFIQNPYPMSEEKKKLYDKFVGELEDQGVVEDADIDKYCSPALIVIQKGRPRLVIDYRKINSMIERDVYPIPLQTDIFPLIQDAAYFHYLTFERRFSNFHWQRKTEIKLRSLHDMEESRG